VNRRLLLTLGVLLAGVLLVGAAAAVVGLRDGGSEPAPALRAADLDRCRGLAGDGARACFTREFLAVLEGRQDPRPAIAAITDVARHELRGFLLTNCHVVMHTVGRTYAREAGVTPATLMDYLPADNDPGCPAGFAHGLVTGIAPDIDPDRPREAAAVCADAKTRFQRYSCIHGFGHAFMRIYDDLLEPALELCGALGAVAAPDCAQGAYHDYWLAVAGADEAALSEEAVTDPRRLCGAQPEAYVRPCWYRAFLESRPEGFAVEAASDLEDLCQGLSGLQRAACVTGAAVIGPPDPADQLRICAAVEDRSDAGNCIRGTKVQNLLDAPDRHLALIRRCASFSGATRGVCYRWLGRTLAVLTDGEFARAGCPQLAAAARRECEAGASEMDEALVTFS
jgi:hypothetical protein